MLKQRINDDLKVAMLAGDKALVAIIRDIKSAILSREVADNKRDEGLDDVTIVAVLKKEQKSRKESFEIYQNAGETERADLEAYQLKVIEEYLPEEMSEAAVQELVDTVLAESNSEISIRDMGRIIGTVKQRADNIDGSLLARIVKEKIER
jgi:uncharacterized protein YqeY